MKKSSVTRRNFMRLGAGFVAAGAAVKATVLEPTRLRAAGIRVRFI